nr:ribonuclease H-like domain-containing protein [Tanacetum cinerariifolium]
GSQEYQVVCMRPDIASTGVDMLDGFDRGLQTNVQVFVDFDYRARKKEIWLKRLLTESGYELRLVEGIATSALVKGCSRSEVPAQVKVATYRTSPVRQLIYLIQAVRDLNNSSRISGSMPFTPDQVMKLISLISDKTGIGETGIGQSSMSDKVARHKQTSNKGSPLSTTLSNTIDPNHDNFISGGSEDNLDKDNTNVIRRSNRSIVLPQRLQDYVVEGKVKYGIEKVLDANNAFLYGDLDEDVYMSLPEGIEVADTDTGLYLNQRKYCLEVLAEYGLLASKPTSTPIEINIVVSDIIKRKWKKVYSLSQFMHKPLQSHVKLAMRVLRYLKGSIGKGIGFNKNSDLSLKAYVDFDWAKCPFTRRPVTGIWLLIFSLKLLEELMSKAGS